MKEQILKLREEGKTYDEIKSILGCSKGTISYHCGKGQKEKSLARTIKRRKKNPLPEKVERFNYRKIKNATNNFQKRDNTAKNNFNSEIKATFNWKDVIEKFGEDTFCYLSGEPINLYNDKNYQLDHIVPVSRGGDNSIDNMGITYNIVNKMKSNLTVEVMLEWCIKILEYNGYNVVKA